MGVDLSKIKPGDEVTVRAVVEVVQGDSFKVRPHPFTIAQWTDQIVSHTPKAPAVGDRVRRPRHCVGDVYLVEHVSGDWCWLKPERATGEGANRGVLSPLSGLERFDAS